MCSVICLMSAAFQALHLPLWSLLLLVTSGYLSFFCLFLVFNHSDPFLSSPLTGCFLFFLFYYVTLNQCGLSYVFWASLWTQACCVALNCCIVAGELSKAPNEVALECIHDWSFCSVDVFCVWKCRCCLSAQGKPQSLQHCLLYKQRPRQMYSSQERVCLWPLHQNHVSFAFDHRNPSMHWDQCNKHEDLMILFDMLFIRTSILFYNNNNFIMTLIPNYTLKKLPVSEDYSKLKSKNTVTHRN